MLLLPFRLKNNKQQTDFYINGMRYRNLPENWNMKIHKDDCLQLIPEPSNPYD
jgi:hypothetical protein